MKILITGHNGRIGELISETLSQDYDIFGMVNSRDARFFRNLTIVKADLTDHAAIRDLCFELKPDVVIHCAAIAHQKVGAVDRETYFKVNSLATENLARVSAKARPDVRFIFLSSVSVYGEEQHQCQASAKHVNQARKINISEYVRETSPCHPSGYYAQSKLDAENRLITLHKQGGLKRLAILRLAPVYDRCWSGNLDKRVLSPRKLAYLRYGTGLQRISALACPNLVAFVRHLLECDSPGGAEIYNVSDMYPYSFAEIIDSFKQACLHPARFSFVVPLWPVWLATRIAGSIFPNNRQWWYACYFKLAGDLVFDNQRMLNTGFRPQHSLKTIF